MKRVAALDLGTNTFLLLIADVDKQGIHRVICDETEVTRLGQGVHQNRRFHVEALARAEKCFARFQQIILKNKVEAIVAVATSAARDVENRDEFFSLGKKYGIPIQVIAGDAEAELTFSGATVGLNAVGEKIVIDVGGGSTEIIGGNSEKDAFGTSVNIGSVRLTELFVSSHPINKQELVKIYEFAKQALVSSRECLPTSKTATVIASAGTPTTLAAVDLGREFDEKLIHGYHISRAKIADWIQRLAGMTVEERQALKGMQANRADVIVAGLSILLAAVDVLGAAEIVVSTKGVRFGLALRWEKYVENT